MTYTYVLEDRELGIYKIGRSKDPHKRFSSLCIRGRIVPIILIRKDIEKELHGLFGHLRVKHKEFIGNGGTEWFRRGGKLSEMLDKVSKDKTLPYITVHSLIEELLADRLMHIGDLSARWELSNTIYGYHRIGIKILYLLGYLRDGGRRPEVKKGTEGIAVIKGKLAIAEWLVDKIKKDFEFFVAPYDWKEYIVENKKEKAISRVCKVPIEEGFMGGGVFLLINKVL